jgi:hypothetical protein
VDSVQAGFICHLKLCVAKKLELAMLLLSISPLRNALRLIDPRRCLRRPRVQSRPVPRPEPQSKDRAEDSPAPKHPSDELDLGGKWLEL